MAVKQEIVYDAANEALVLRAAIALAQSNETEERNAFRALVHSIGEDEFLVAQHVSLWKVLRRLSDGALEYSPETVRQMAAVEANPVDEAQLEELENTAGIPDNLEWHVQTLRWDATRARVMRGGLPALVADLTDPKVTVERAVTSARSVVRALEGGSGRRYIHRPGELEAGYKTELRNRQQKGNFFPCGYEAVDALMSEGFMPGRTCIIAGLSGSGKSTLAAGLAINMARMGRKPMICAWEMGGYSMLDVMVAMMTGIELESVIHGTFMAPELKRLDKATSWITRRIRFMENAFFQQIDNEKQRRFSNDRNLDILEGYIAESGCDEIIMDLWDRILADQSPDAVTAALYRQQHMHQEYGVHGTLLVQLRGKDVEKRADKRPTRESIKGVGTFVEVADLIFGVHRDAQFKAVPDNTVELICLKQRKGKLNWAVRFGWDGERSQITGGEQVPYNPGLDAATEFGEIDDPSAIKTRPARNRGINRRD